MEKQQNKSAPAPHQGRIKHRQTAGKHARMLFCVGHLVLFAVILFARYWSVLSAACACTAALKFRSLRLHSAVCVASRRGILSQTTVPPDQRMLPLAVRGSEPGSQPGSHVRFRARAPCPWRCTLPVQHDCHNDQDMPTP